MKRIIIACDHVSLPLKVAVIEFLQKNDLDVVDLGTYSSDVIVDYNDYAQKVAKAVVKGEGNGGIVICGTGLGASIAANKVKGARAALCHDVFTAHQARAHNDANILAIGAWIVSPERMPGIVQEWLSTPFEGGRHTARVKLLDRFMGEGTNGISNVIFPNEFKFSMALSIQKTVFGPVLFSGRVEEGFAALRNAGFSYVELSLRNAEDIVLKELVWLLEKYSLKVTALATGQGCLHDQLCLSSINPDVHSAAIKRMMNIIDLAAVLKADVIIGGVRGKLDAPERDRATQRERIFDGVRQCCSYADNLGITLLLEAINRYETNFINSALDARAFINEVGASNLKVLLDTFHMNIEEVDLPTAIRMTGDALGYLHFVDSNRQSPGQGHIDLISVLNTLSEIGYRGVVSAEILPLPDDASAVQRTANYLEAIGVKLEKK
ncbi:MAG: sugar phosphate isomerase/epimerase [uncultured bacterium]|nr:MAG: sugar phosphate isomerase/epimerase [uncultured bacterium]